MMGAGSKPASFARSIVKPPVMALLFIALARGTLDIQHLSESAITFAVLWRRLTGHFCGVQPPDQAILPELSNSASPPAKLEGFPLD
jgi:hypothetical protein